MTLEGFAAERPVVTLDRQRRPARVRRGRRHRPRVRARAQGRSPTRSTGCSLDRDAAGADGTAGNALVRAEVPALARRRRPAAGLMLHDTPHAPAPHVPPRPGSDGELVFAGPLPPAPTGIATYDRAVLDGLAADRVQRAPPDGRAVADRAQGHARRFPGYRLGIFQLGNNVEFHLEVYRAAFLTPASDGAARPRAGRLRPRAHDARASRSASWRRARPPRCDRNLTSPDVLRNEPLRDPWCAHVAAARARHHRALGVLHGATSRSSVAARRSSSCRTRSVESPEADMRSRRSTAAASSARRSKPRGARTVVVAPGDLNEAKRLDAVLGGDARARRRSHVALVGRRIRATTSTVSWTRRRSRRSRDAGARRLG